MKYSAYAECEIIFLRLALFSEGATLHSRGARKLLALPLTSKLDALCGSKPNRFPCAWRKKTRSVARVARPKAKSTPFGVLLLLEAPPGFGPGIRVLQTRALPLGHGAVFRIL